MRLSIACEAQACESLSNFLFEQGARGVEEQESGIVGYFTDIKDTDTLLRAVKVYIDNLCTLGYSVGDLDLADQPIENWETGWHAYFQPIRVTPHMIIKPPWAVWSGPEKIIIDIHPQMAFGTGSHETTQLCLALIEKYCRPDNIVLDIGTGSGILAIAAAKLGSQCLAVDIDEDAIQNCRHNVHLNHVNNRIEIIHGSIDSISKKRFDIILANINRKVLLDHVQDMMDFCHSETKLILSGILIEEQDIIVQKLGALNMYVTECRTRGEWAGLVVHINQ